MNMMGTDEVFFPREKAPIYDLVYSKVDECYYCVPAGWVDT